jgi:hypothetical protein
LKGGSGSKTASATRHHDEDLAHRLVDAPLAARSRRKDGSLAKEVDAHRVVEVEEDSGASARSATVQNQRTPYGRASSLKS